MKHRILLIFLTLGLVTHNLFAQHVVSYVGGTSRVAFKTIFMLSDSTFLIGGQCTGSLTAWLPSSITPIYLDTTGAGPINSSSAGVYKAFILHVTKNFSSIINVLSLPYAADVTKIKTNAIPGTATGNLFISGQRSGGSSSGPGGASGYFLGKLDNNFISGTPSKFVTVTNISVGPTSTGKTSFDVAVGYHMATQPWDVDPFGRVIAAYGQDFDFQWAEVARYKASSFNVQDAVKNWPQSVVTIDTSGNNSGQFKKVTAYAGSSGLSDSVWYEANGKWKKYKIGQVVQSDLVAKIAGTGNRTIVSITNTDWSTLQTDENGNSGRWGKYPLDYAYGFAYPVYPDTLATGSQLPFSVANPTTGYSTANIFTSRICDIEVDKRNGNMYIALAFALNNGSGLSEFQTPDQFGFGGYDYDAVVAAMDSTGKLLWWNRLQKLDPSAPNYNAAFINDLEIDYLNNKLAVLAIAYDTTQNNFWEGNALLQKPAGSAFMNKFTGSNNTIQYSWLAKYSIATSNPGVITDATYIGETGKLGNPYGTKLTAPNLDGWNDPNTGNPNLENTYCGKLSIALNGDVYVTGLGVGFFANTSSGPFYYKQTRTITTANAYQKMFKPDANPILDSMCGANSFVRVYSSDLSTLKYSSLLTGRWTPANVSGNGGGNTWLFNALPINNGLVVVGNATGTGRNIPTFNVPSWGDSVITTTNVPNGILAKLDFNQVIPTPTSPLSGNGVLCIGHTKTYSIKKDPNALRHVWNITNITATLTGPNPTTIVSTVGQTDTSITLTALAKGTVTLWVWAIYPNGQGASVVKNITVGPPPTAPVITPLPQCAGINQTYTFTPNTNDSTYKDSITSTNWVSSIGSGYVNLMPLKYSASVDTIKLTALNACGTSATKSFPISITLQSTPAPSISGPVILNVPYAITKDSVFTYSINSIPNATKYFWSLNDTTRLGFSGLTQDTLTTTDSAVKIAVRKNKLPKPNTPSLSVVAYSPSGCLATAQLGLTVTHLESQAVFESQLSVSPNPTSGTLYIASGVQSGVPLKVAVYNIIGSPQTSATLDTGSGIVDLSSLSSGVYLVSISQGNNKVVKRIIKL